MSYNKNSELRDENNMVQTELINLFCPVCDCQYINKKQFYEHLRTHAGDAWWKHAQCLKKNGNIESETELKYSNQEKFHNPQENVVRPFKCQQCNLTFDRASQYDYHHRSIHLGEKSQLCEICGKGFFRKADLRTHLNIHLGTNVCICEVCGRKFNHISNLIRHCRMHAGVKPYPCSICGKRFTQISSLARHKHIHERLQENVKHQMQSNSDNDIIQKKDHVGFKNKFVKGNSPNQQKVVRRQHYCKICGESFSFIFLLREHEKTHSQSTSVLELKNNEMKMTELKEDKYNADNLDIFENETNLKSVLPLETIINITSEQLKKINLENMEGSKNHVLPGHLEELNETVETTGKLKEEQTQLANGSPVLQHKSNELKDKENLVCVCEIDEPVLKSKSSIKSLTNHEHLSYTQLCEPDLQKSDTLQNSDILTNTSVNVTDMFQRIDLSESNTSVLNVLKHQDINAVQNEKNIVGFNDDNNITNHDESMLRLVQTETGEQFYEFLISNLIEKLPNVQSAKVFENKDESTNVSGNETNTCLNIKNSDEEVRQNVRDDDLNYTQYELQGDEKNFITNQNLLDPHAELDKYVETNFEVFERLNYDDSPERFLEFVEISGVGNQSLKMSGCKENEQFLQFQNFSQCDSVEENEKDNTVNNNEQVLFATFKEHTPCEININSDQIVEKDEKESLTRNVKESGKPEDQQQKLKKIKEFLIKFQCTVCEKSFSTSYNYKQHIGTHFADQQKFHCKECKMSFAWKSTLNKHITSNHRPEGPQKFACDICKKVYNTSSQVNEHVKRDHLKERNHVCSYCGKSFFKKYDLKIHNRIHTDERPYVCRVCGKRFHHRSHIIRHERIHF